MNELEQKIIKWADDRGLIYDANSDKQLLKTMEELGETARSSLKGDINGVRDGVGDILVTLIIFAHQKDLTINECLETAWNEIKDRKGKTVKGTFIKN